jgi:hypothetical protein
MTGTYSTDGRNPLIEMNNVALAANTLVWARMRSIPGGEPLWECLFDPAITPTSGIAVVGGSEGSGSVSGVTTATFDYCVISGTTPNATITINSATQTLIGVVTTAAQDFSGEKSFQQVDIFDSGGLTIARDRTVITSPISGPSLFTFWEAYSGNGWGGSDADTITLQYAEGGISTQILWIGSFGWDFGIGPPTTANVWGNFSYDPAASANWKSTPPVTLGGAMDRIVAWIAANFPILTPP